MEKYIALLRGVNVGGKNKISMPALKLAFEEIGFLDVITYINSGNIIFSSNIQDENDLIRKCESVIADKFMLSIPVAIVSPIDLSQALNNAPEWWNIDKGSIHYAIFVIWPFTVEEVFVAVGEAKSEYEKVASYGNVIFWTAPSETISKTRWYKIASSSANNKVTIRNANTVNKLLLLTK